MTLIVEHLLGMGFLFVAVLSLTSYNEEWHGLRLDYFYKELKPMQNRWGTIPGTVLHLMAYVVAPLGFGLLFLMGFVL
ncbi:MAG: hypothetical protein EHM70_13120 [Chloroflexota bacterium]|nr:MAG: hypothetical protein EHM70_13120 [Chloroflexota bacterium]